MTILYVKEVPGRRVSVTRENVRNATRKFRVRSDVQNESTFAIRTHTEIPKPWSLHPTEPFCFADVPQITQRKTKYHWDVEVDYTSEIDGEEQPKNPLQRRAEIDWTSQAFTRIAFRDRKGKPILNTAGDPPEGGGLPVEDSFWVIAVEKNVPRVPKKIVTENYASAVNQETVHIDGVEFKPNTLKAAAIRISRQKREEGIRFRTMTVEYHTRPETWTQTMLNRGFNQMVAEYVDDLNGGLTLIGKTREKILIGGDDGKVGEPPSEAAFLDMQGRYIEKPDRQIRVVKGGTVEEPKPLPADDDDRETELKKRRQIIVLEWDVEKSKPFRGVLPLS